MIGSGLIIKFRVRKYFRMNVFDLEGFEMNVLGLEMDLN